LQTPVTARKTTAGTCSPLASRSRPRIAVDVFMRASSRGSASATSGRRGGPEAKPRAAWLRR
jgi:hypothetical protein